MNAMHNREDLLFGSHIELRMRVVLLEAELAAIRAAFPSDHPAREKGDVSAGVREMVKLLQEIRQDAINCTCDDCCELEPRIAAALGTPKVEQP